MHVKISTLAEYSFEINEILEMAKARCIFYLTGYWAERNISF